VGGSGDQWDLGRERVEAGQGELEGKERRAAARGEEEGEMKGVQLRRPVPGLGAAGQERK
jgi:hypothetical protein